MNEQLKVYWNMFIDQFSDKLISIAKLVKTYRK